MKIAARIALIYIIFCGLYIVGSDYGVLLFFKSSEEITVVQSYKGLFFVLLSGLLIFLLIRRSIHQLKASNIQLVDTIHYHRMIFDKCPLPAFIWDKNDFTYLRVNDAALFKFGFSKEEFLRSTAMDLNEGMSIDDLRSLMYDVSPSGYVEIFIQGKTKSGSILHLQLFCQNVIHEGKESVFCIAMDITALKDPEVKIMDRMLGLLEEERMNISSEIHDGIKQYFGIANGILKSVKAKYTEFAGLKGIEKAIDLTAHGVEESRRLSHTLTPMLVDDTHLDDIILQLVDDLNYISKISFRYTSNLERKYSSELVLNLFRIVQESTRNVMIHSRAMNCHIDLNEQDGNLCLTVSDDGKGFDTNLVSKSLGSIGLNTMRTRATKLGGFFTLTSEPDKGTSIQVKIPVADVHEQS